MQFQIELANTTMKKNAISNKEIELLRLENNKLKQQVAELSDFFENAPVPMHWLDENGIIIWANEAEYKTFGYDKEEYIGSSIQNYHVKKDVIFDILVRLRSGEIILEYPAEIKCKDGSIKNVRINSSAHTMEDKFTHTQCFTRDVTAAVKEEKSNINLLKRLEEGETRLRLAVESTRLGTWEWDTANDSFYISKEGRIIFGLPSRGKIRASILFESFLSKNENFIEKHKIALFDSGENGYFDITQKIKKINDGSIRTIRIQGAIHNKKNSAAKFIGTMLDITDMDSAQENDARLAAIIRSSNDAIVGKNLNGIITYWNIAAERIFGYSEQEMIGKSILSIIPQDRTSEEDLIQSRMRLGDIMEHFETKRLTKSGKLIDVSLTLSPIKDKDDKIVGIAKIARDITEKKQEEKRKHDFVTMVSHEIKTPLTSILLNTQVLLKRFRNDENNDALSIGLKIEAQTKKIISMVKDYLSISRIEDGKINLVKEQFSLELLILDIVEEAKFVTANHEIIVEDCEGIAVLADRSKIEQVLVNLLNNAIKYSPIGSKIRIKCIRQEHMVTISISDQGIGIKKEEQNEIFKRFYRIDKDKTNTIAGFGIGLYLVTEILKEHGSSIHVQSREGEGSTFYFDLDLLPNI